MTTEADEIHERSRQAEAIVKLLPTSRHAEALFDTTLAMLGDRAVVEGIGGRTIYLRDLERPELLAPWPLLRLAVGEDYVKPGVFDLKVIIDGVEHYASELAVPPFERAEVVAPKIRGLKPGELTIGGSASLTITYDERGLEYESVLRDSDQPGESRALLDALYGAAQARVGIEGLASLIAEFPVPAAGRVLLPPGCKQRAQHAWGCGLGAMRRALWSRPAGVLPRWVVADGFAGTAIAWGESLDEALASWRQLIEKHPPRIVPFTPERDVVRELPPWEASSPEMEEIRSRFQSVEPIPEPPALADMPAAILRLEGTPPGAPPAQFAAAGFARWQPLLGSRGHLSFGLVRDDPDGWLLAGQDALDHPHPDTIDDATDALDVEAGRLPSTAPPMEIEDPIARQVVACHWRRRDLAWRDGKLCVLSRFEMGGFDAAGLDGDVQRSRLARLRYIV